ncbi:MAG: indole-3-glycerol phosphate synthase [Candidatus Aenigmarchaeota archaeon ex4484_52]|nr:MAG: indole-3-glycerol phosphate synthase [Candidatus Aenigmarchaeota archaeon ex4484_52]
MTILTQIIKNKKSEVKKRKKLHPLNSFIDKISKSNRNFFSAIKKTNNKINLIAEIKFSSPTIADKIINPAKTQIIKIAKLYNKYAKAISVITDEKYFSGKLEYLKIARQITNIPILRKDFIIDKYQIYESRYFGAEAILLIADILKKEQLNEYLKIAKNLNMSCLVEAHTIEDIKKILKTDAKIIGINNRNLKTLKIDLNTTIKLRKEIPKDIIVVSESGIKNKKDIDFLGNANIDAVLIGTAIMEQKDEIKKEEKIKELKNLLNGRVKETVKLL